jgi:hypothetical protein
MKYIFIGAAFICLMHVSCTKDDNNPVPKPPEPTDQSFSTSFESMDELSKLGFVFKNLSDNPADGWTIQDGTSWGEVPYDGSKLLDDNPFIATADPYDTLTGAGVISDWLISPALYFQNGDKISFYTVSHGSIGYGPYGSYPDRLQLRLNIFNTSDSIGQTSADVGYFTNPLLDINSLFKVSPPNDYPSTWTKYEVTISGLNQPDSGRFALRYYLPLNGGANGDELAIDKLEFTSVNH